MIASSARVLTIAALCLAIGLHWFLIQSVAWTTMIVKYSARGSLTEAVSKTFDGEHPCSLCLVVQKGKTEKKSELQPLAPKFNLFVARAASEIRPAAVSFEYRSLGVSFSARGEAPPIPPPRFALV